MFKPVSFSLSQKTMPRNPKKRLGSRAYANYSPETLEECLNSIRSGQLSQRVAATRFGVPRSTIKNKLKRIHCKKVGRGRVFTEPEETAFEQHLIKLSDYGFPVVESDFRMAIKNYLDKKGAVVHRFKENIPGYEWTKSFLKRHHNLSVRISSNIKKARAQVGATEINNYMDNLSVAIKDIPPSRIWNYDETNLSDDPGNKKVICKRGAKYVEKICNFSKSSTSIMFCGNANGKCLAPYIVYKSEHIWSTWTENGPEHARYNRSKSGWFDSTCFEDWFEAHFLPEVRHENGPIVLIGDNLSSHISIRVLQLCQQHNIRFVCLPPNTTHLTQPLDVAFFAPTKKVWRSILTKWKESKSGSKYPTIPKDVFPTLLKELMNSLQQNTAQNLISGFKKCGIYPLNKQILLDRLPENVSEVDKNFIGDSFLEQLDKKRADFLGSNGPKKVRKKLQVPPGKSISVTDVTEATAGPSKSQASLKRQRKVSFSSSSDEDDSTAVSLESDEVSETFSDLEESLTGANDSVNIEKLKPEEYAVNNYVIVLFNGEKYPGKIISISQEGPIVDCMEKGLKFWRWPERKDAIIYEWEDVLCKINSPKVISKRNQFLIPELQNFV